MRDLPRNSQGRALIGDMRNDENGMVSQLQLAFLLAHNTLVDRAWEVTADPDRAFDLARRSLRWLYQWVVWHDFLGRVLDPAIHAAALVNDPDDNGRLRWKPGYKDVYAWKNQPYMPIEFSVAAYRFGHSMVRNSYPTNIHRGFQRHVPIFTRATDDPDDLRGFRALHQRNCIQWDWFLDMESSIDGFFPQRAADRH